MSKLTKQEIWDINKQLLEYNLEILPLVTGSLNAHKNILIHKLNHSEILLENILDVESEKKNNENYLDELSFRLIPRITLKNHLENEKEDEVLNRINIIFKDIEKIEKLYKEVKDESILEEAETYKEELKLLYKVLDKPVWVLIEGDNGEVVNDFFEKISPLKNQEAKKLKR